MDQTTERRQLNDSTGSFCFSARKPCINYKGVKKNKAKHLDTLPFFILFASLSFPATFREKDEKGNFTIGNNLLMICG